MKREEHLARLEKVNKIDASHKDYLVYLSFHRDLKRAIKAYAKGILLDIGCGNKPYEVWFDNKISKYIGCDIVQSSSNKVDVLCEANNIPLDDNSFDTILSTQVIEHVEDHQGLVNEAFRLLKTNGVFILSGPFNWPIHEEPYDFFRFSKYGFKYILEKAGFEIVETMPNGGAWATLGQTINHTFTFTNPKANKVARSIKYVFRKLKCHVLINKVFAYLDVKDSNPINTLNYVIVAKKN